MSNILSNTVIEKLRSKYPNLPFKINWELTQKSISYLGQCEAYVKAISNTPIMPEHADNLRHVAFNKGAQATTAIEGNTLTEEEVDKVSGGEKLAPSQTYQEIEVRNVLNAFHILVFEVVRDNQCYLISPDLIKRFHKLIGQDLGDQLNAIPGQFRTSNVTVAKYRCPDYGDVEDLIDLFCEWLKDEFCYECGDQTFSDIVIQSIVSHIYIELIHPFGDGNGRTGRLIEFYILLRGGNPHLALHILSNHYNKTRTEYYRQIDNVTKKRDLSGFIEYALLGFRDGLEATLLEIQKSQFAMTWHKVIYDKFSEDKTKNKVISKRRREIILALPYDKYFKATDIYTLNATTARLYANKSLKSIERDLSELKQMGLLNRTLDNKYIANVSLIKKLMAYQKPSN